MKMMVYAPLYSLVDCCLSVGGLVLCVGARVLGGRAGPVPPLLRPDSQSPAAGQ